MEVVLSQRTNAKNAQRRMQMRPFLFQITKVALRNMIVLPLSGETPPQKIAKLALANMSKWTIAAASIEKKIAGMEAA